MDLEEIAALHQGAGPAAVGAERGHEGGEHHHAGIEEELGHLADAADVLLPVGIGKAQVGAEAVAHVVAIEHIAGQPLLKQGRVHRIGEGALAGAAQAREPEDGAAVAPLVGPGRPGHGGVVPHDVGGDPRLRGASRAGHRAVVSVGGGGGHGGRNGGGGGLNSRSGTWPRPHHSQQRQTMAQQRQTRVPLLIRSPSALRAAPRWLAGAFAVCRDAASARLSFRPPRPPPRSPARGWARSSAGSVPLCRAGWRTPRASVPGLPLSSPAC